MTKTPKIKCCKNIEMNVFLLLQSSFLWLSLSHRNIWRQESMANQINQELGNCPDLSKVFRRSDGKSSVFLGCCCSSKSLASPDSAGPVPPEFGGFHWCSIGIGACLRGMWKPLFFKHRTVLVLDFIDGFHSHWAYLSLDSSELSAI